jgi:hypothetical protein
MRKIQRTEKYKENFEGPSLVTPTFIGRRSAYNYTDYKRGIQCRQYYSFVICYGVLWHGIVWYSMVCFVR